MGRAHGERSNTHAILISHRKVRYFVEKEKKKKLGLRSRAGARKRTRIVESIAARHETQRVNEKYIIQDDEMSLLRDKLHA